MNNNMITDDEFTPIENNNINNNLINYIKKERKRENNFIIKETITVVTWNQISNLRVI